MAPLTLKNTENFHRIKYAQITLYSHSLACNLIVTYTDFGVSDWYAKSEIGAKMIFSREFGKGAIWEKSIN
jgi:hypothetical protein